MGRSVTDRVPPPRLVGTIKLRDGRDLGYAEYGPPTGRPVLWFHGTPGASGQVPPAARLTAAQRGVRIIAVERPGVGGSTPHLYQRVLDWADDVQALADALGFDAFGIVAVSGGGPYLLACAYEMPERVVAGAWVGWHRAEVTARCPEAWWGSPPASRRS